MLELLAVVEPTTTVSGSDALLIGAVIALANVVVKLGESLLCFLKRVRVGSSSSITASACPICQRQVEAVHDIVVRTDSSGTPLVYASRELADRVYDTVTELRAVCKSNDRLVTSIDNMVEENRKKGV